MYSSLLTGERPKLRGGRPYLRPPQQIGVDEHPQMRRVTNGRHANIEHCGNRAMANVGCRQR
jgi:hypothetical protein